MPSRRSRPEPTVSESDTRHSFVEVQELSAHRHAVNVLFDEIEYIKLVRKAADLTVKEGRRVSVAELVRRLTLSKDDEFVEEIRNA